MKTKELNPLLCNPDTGVCEIPGAAGGGESRPKAKPVRIVYYTDPICSSCWGIEPQLRRLKLEYGDHFEIDYRMGGLLPDWSYNSGGISKPADVAHHWEEVSEHYQMPIDGGVWLEDPLSSSYPPSIAVKAAQLQDKQKAVDFMRKLRELLFLDKKNITRWEVIREAAAAVGLDTYQLKEDYEGPARKLFEEDLAYGRQLGVRGFPTLFFTDAENNQLTLYGFRPYASFEASLLKVFPQADKKPIDLKNDMALFGHFATLTPKEYSVLAGIPLQEAERTLEALADAGRLDRQAIKNGVLYKRR